ncbi:NAD-binding protein, partial [Candidatus Dependentiae bacterium]|nr:NAD-binding protein [Candidatus Dependentiae bacterium]
MNILKFIKKIIIKIYKNIIYFFTSNKNAKIFTMALVFIFAVAVIFYYIERKYNDGYGSFLDSLYWTVVTVSTCGYGDISPKTPLGRFLDIFVLIIGVGLVGVVTGSITTLLVEKQLKEGRGLTGLQNLKDHFIICGWREGMFEFLVEILKMNPSYTSDKVVLINMRDQNDISTLKSEPELRDLHYIYGDFVEEASLLRANIKTASRILVLADTSFSASPQEIDSRTVMTIMTIDSLNKHIYSCAEIFDSKFKRHLEMSHCNEIVLS